MSAENAAAPVKEDVISPHLATLDLIQQLLTIYDSRTILQHLNQCDPSPRPWLRTTLNSYLKSEGISRCLDGSAVTYLQQLLPAPPAHHPDYQFRFIDLFAGIGGLRQGFSAIGGQCVFTSEWNKYAVRTYKANWFNDSSHKFNHDIRDITLSNKKQISEQQSLQHINQHIPQHDVLLAGFPCQPFSLAGVSKKNSLGRAHGFACQTQGTLFFDVVRILQAKRPAFFVLENVKNLKSHDQGNTFRIIMQTLDELGYDVADSQYQGKNDPKIIDGSFFLPQHRERIVLVGIRRDLQLADQFTLRDIEQFYPAKRPLLADLLESRVDNKYILSPKLWHYLFHYAKKHAAKGNGFGFGLVNPQDAQCTTRTLSARYHKDGSEILIDRGWDALLAEKNFGDESNQSRRPRRLTPRECARLMGFEQPAGKAFTIPVSDTQAYRQFGNSVVVPVFSAVAKLLQPLIEQVVKNTK